MQRVFECPLRWADMDLLGHVNNVRYFDYLAMARWDLFGGSAAAQAPVVRHQVSFDAPLVFGRLPVKVATWVAGSDESTVTLCHEVYDDTMDAVDPAAAVGVDAERRRVVHFRAETVLAHSLSTREHEVAREYRGEPLQWRPVPGGTSGFRHVYPLHLRLADLPLRADGARRAGDVAHVEFFQEARISYMMHLHQRGEKWTEHVVASTEITHLAEVPFRTAPYEIRSRIGHLGTKSFTIEADLYDGERALATSRVVMVTFDQATQRATAMAAPQRARLERELA